MNVDNVSESRISAGNEFHSLADNSNFGCQFIFYYSLILFETTTVALQQVRCFQGAVAQITNLISQVIRV